MRVPGIDTFRGFTIVTMVFYSLTALFSNDLPALFNHNKFDRLFIGDFVLPLFVFSSGMSMVFFDRKRKKHGTTKKYITDVGKKLLKLIPVSLVLSPFICGEIGAMDEIMLNAILFPVTLVFLQFSVKTSISTMIGIAVSYILLGQIGLLPDFREAYLGGYSATPFYLIIMLGGTIAARVPEKIHLLLFWSLIAFLGFCLFTDPLKFDVTPSFMALSVAISAGVYIVFRDLRNPQLEYLGRRPLRYWIHMIVLFTVPIRSVTIATETLYPINLPWQIAGLAALAAVVFLYAETRALDWIKETIRKAESSRKNKQAILKETTA